MARSCLRQIRLVVASLASCFEKIVFSVVSKRQTWEKDVSGNRRAEFATWMAVMPTSRRVGKYFSGVGLRRAIGNRFAPRNRHNAIDAKKIEEKNVDLLVGIQRATRTARIDAPRILFRNLGNARSGDGPPQLGQSHSGGRCLGDFVCRKRCGTARRRATFAMFLPEWTVRRGRTFVRLQREGFAWKS